MNKAKLLQSILELHKAVKDCNMEKMYRCAYELRVIGTGTLIRSFINNR